MISLIIPATSSNQIYTDFAVQKIRDLYPNEDEVEIIVEINDNVTLGINYNNAVDRAKGDVVVLMHNDMVPHQGFVETILKYIQRKRLIVYQRVEPPIFNDLYVGKVIYDCGETIENFNDFRFKAYTSSDTLIDGGSQLFFAVYKEDYLPIDGNTFVKFCEDDDVHLRYKLAGYECKVATAAMVYHFVSKTSRIGNHQEIEIQSNLSFIKKWGFRTSKHNKVYKKTVEITGEAPADLKKALDIWFPYSVEQANVVTKLNVNTFMLEDYKNIMNLNDIIYETGEVGEFELGNIQVDVKSLDSFEKELIFII